MFKSLRRSGRDLRIINLRFFTILKELNHECLGLQYHVIDYTITQHFKGVVNSHDYYIDEVTVLLKFFDSGTILIPSIILLHNIIRGTFTAIFSTYRLGNSSIKVLLSRH